MPLLGLGGALKVAGAAIKGMVNRAREKRAQKKEAKAAQKVAEANSILANKLGIISGASEATSLSGGGVMDEKLFSKDSKNGVMLQWIKKNILLVIGVVVALVVGFFVFKPRRKRR